MASFDVTSEADLTVIRFRPSPKGAVRCSDLLRGAETLLSFGLLKGKERKMTKQIIVGASAVAMPGGRCWAIPNGSASALTGGHWLRVRRPSLFRRGVRRGQPLRRLFLSVSQRQLVLGLLLAAAG